MLTSVVQPLSPSFRSAGVPPSHLRVFVLMYFQGAMLFPHSDVAFQLEGSLLGWHFSVHPFSHSAPWDVELFTWCINLGRICRSLQLSSALFLLEVSFLQGEDGPWCSSRVRLFPTTWEACLGPRLLVTVWLNLPYHGVTLTGPPG